MLAQLYGMIYWKGDDMSVEVDQFLLFSSLSLKIFHLNGLYQ